MSWNMMLVRGSGEGNKTNTRRKLVERQGEGQGLWNMKRKKVNAGKMERTDRAGETDNDRKYQNEYLR